MTNSRVTTSFVRPEHDSLTKRVLDIAKKSFHSDGPQPLYVHGLTEDQVEAIFGWSGHSQRFFAGIDNLRPLFIWRHKRFVDAQLHAAMLQALARTEWIVSHWLVQVWDGDPNAPPPLQ